MSVSPKIIDWLFVYRHRKTSVDFSRRVMDCLEKSTKICMKFIAENHKTTLQTIQDRFWKNVIELVERRKSIILEENERSGEDKFTKDILSRAVERAKSTEDFKKFDDERFLRLEDRVIERRVNLRKKIRGSDFVFDGRLINLDNKFVDEMTLRMARPEATVAERDEMIAVNLRERNAMTKEWFAEKIQRCAAFYEAEQESNKALLNEEDQLDISSIGLNGLTLVEYCYRD